MFLLPRRRQGPPTGFSAIAANAKAFWPFGDAHDAVTLVDSTGRGNDLTPYIRITRSTNKFVLGANSEGGQVGLASLAKAGRWERVLTPTEKAAIAGGEGWPFSTTTSLQDAKAYFPLDEPGGSTTYADATGRGNDLTASGGTTVRTAGPFGVGYGTELPSGTILSKTSPGDDLAWRQQTCTVVIWVKLNAKSSSQQGFWVQLSNGFDSGLNLAYDNSAADRFACDFDGGSGKHLNAGLILFDNALGSPAVGTWYCLFGEYDQDANTVSHWTDARAPEVMYERLQPAPVAAKIGSGSKFNRNRGYNFPAKISGWDYDPGYPTLGASRAELTVNADVSIGNNSKVVWGWFKATDTNYFANQILAGVTGMTGPSTDWYVQLYANQLSFVFGRELATVSVAFTDTTSFHLVVVWFNKVANTIHIDVDHSASQASAAGPATPQTSAQKLVFGAYPDNQFEGVLNAWGIADGIPNQDDLDFLWNSGSGISLP